MGSATAHVTFVSVTRTLIWVTQIRSRDSQASDLSSADRKVGCDSGSTTTSIKVDGSDTRASEPPWAWEIKQTEHP